MKRACVAGRYFVSTAGIILAWILVCHAGEMQDITPDCVIRQTNVERAERNVPVLKGNNTLNHIAHKRLEDMLEKNYFAHTSPSGESVTDIAESLHYEYSRIGENLAKGNFKSAADLVTFWMKSPPHKKNLLSRDFKDIGVAVAADRVEGRDCWYAVQVFGTMFPGSRGP